MSVCSATPDAPSLIAVAPLLGTGRPASNFCFGSVLPSPQRFDVVSCPLRSGHSTRPIYGWAQSVAVVSAGNSRVLPAAIPMRDYLPLHGAAANATASSATDDGRCLLILGSSGFYALDAERGLGIAWGSHPPSFERRLFTFPHLQQVQHLLAAMSVLKLQLRKLRRGRSRKLPGLLTPHRPLQRRPPAEEQPPEVSLEKPRRWAPRRQARHPQELTSRYRTRLLPLRRVVALLQE